MSLCSFPIKMVRSLFSTICMYVYELRWLIVWGEVLDANGSSHCGRCIDCLSWWLFWKCFFSSVFCKVLFVFCFVCSPRSSLFHVVIIFQNSRSSPGCMSTPNRLVNCPASCRCSHWLHTIHQSRSTRDIRKFDSCAKCEKSDPPFRCYVSIKWWRAGGAS